MFAVGLGAAQFSPFPSYFEGFEGFGRSDRPTQSFSLDDIVRSVSEVCCFDTSSLGDSEADEGSYYDLSEPPLVPFESVPPLPVPPELESSAAPSSVAQSSSGELSWSEIESLLSWSESEVDSPRSESTPPAPTHSVASVSDNVTHAQALPFSKEGTGDSNRARDAAERALKDALGSSAMKTLKQRHTRRGKPPIKHLSYGLVRHYAIENGVRLPSTDDLRAVGWDWKRVPEDQWRVPVGCERYEKDLCAEDGADKTCTRACETCSKFRHGTLRLPTSSRKRPRSTSPFLAGAASAFVRSCAAVGQEAKAARPTHRVQSAVLPQAV